MSRPICIVAALLAAVLSAGSCGKKGPPQPPEPRGPLPPRDVQARQVGATAEVHFSMPGPRGPKPAQLPERIELVRVEFSPGLTPPADPDTFRRRGKVVAVDSGAPFEPGRRLRLTDATLDQLPGGPSGWILWYGVRVRDHRGRPSPLVVAADLVAIAPLGAPGKPVAEATADGIRLTWEAPSGEGPFRYNVYRAAANELQAERPLNREPVTSSDYLDVKVQTGQEYVYTVRTVGPDAPALRESASGPEVRVVAEDRFPPAPPDGLVAVQEGMAVRLFWNPSPERDLEGYRVERRADDGEWITLEPPLVLQPLFLDTGVHPDQSLEYRVIALDRSSPPNESAPSGTVDLEVVREPVVPGSERP